MRLRISVLLLVSSALLSSCSTHRIYPKFTTTPKVVTLRGNDSKEVVQGKLGCPPYDLYLVQKDGYSIYQWYYKRELREISRKKLILREYHSNGDPRLEKKLSEAFLIFNNSDKLYSILTRSGRGDLLSLTLFNNDFKEVNGKRLDIWFDPDSKKAVSSEGVVLSYQQIIDVIDEFFDGNSDIKFDEIYEMIDQFFEQ